MEILDLVVTVLFKFVFLWLGTGVILLCLLWPVNDKPVPKYRQLLGVLFLFSYWWFLIQY